MHFSTLFSATALAQLTLAGYVLQDDYMSGDFYDNFEFFTAPDPTHGFVQYVDQSTAQSMNLLNASAGAAVGWGVDTVNKDEAGRASVRLTSKKVYNHGLVMIDVEHMPVGCGTWPAFWMVGPNWPNGGEIDILEGVHEQESNSVTLHTGAGCSIGEDTSVFSGEVATKNCDIKAPGQDENKGCSINQKNPQSYGAGLNSNGGGVFATEWTSEAISVWFFARGDIAADLLGENPDPSSWGKPAAQFVKSGCEIDSFFKDQQIVFDTTFCGDWAGNTWSDSCAAKTGEQNCINYVRDNPEAFVDAFWTVNSLKVYSNDGSAAPQPSGLEDGDSPVQTGEPTDAPVPTNKPIDALVPIEQPTEPTELPTDIPTNNAPAPTSSGFESPPIVDPSEVPSVSSPTDAVTAPISTGAGATNPVPETIAPSAKRSMGGFTWPAGDPAADETETAVPSSTTVEAPFPTGNSTLPSTTATEVPLPTGNSTLASTTAVEAPAPPGNGTLPLPIATESLSSIDFNTVPSFPASMPLGVTSTSSPAPANTGAAAVPTAVPGEEAPSTSCTKPPQPAETAPVRMARHAREHRRRMVKHNPRN